MALVMAATTGSGSAAVPEAAGRWQGAIELPAGELRVTVELVPGDDGWSGTIDIPAQGAAGLPLAAVAVEGADLRFSIAGVPGEPTFEGALAGGEILGTFVQGGARMPFTLARAGDEELRPPRPQEPEPPFPYAAEEVTLASGEVRLAGTLTLPAGEGPHPAVVLLSGSGAQDRDESVFGHKPFLVLADSLTRAGIAVLRLDDRGVGGSTGDVEQATTADLAPDALAAVGFLGQRPEVDGRRVGLVGHSEGALVATLAASESPAVAFVVMLAGSGVPGREVLARQNELILGAGGVPASVIGTHRELLERVIERVIAGDDAEAARRVLESADPAEIGQLPAAERELAEQLAESLEQRLERLTSPWFRFFLTYDPRPALEKCRVPVLALVGELDLQVPWQQNLGPIEEALERGGNRDATVRRLPGLNHLFQRAETGSPREYAAIEETMDPAVLELIRQWILERFG